MSTKWYYIEGKDPRGPVSKKYILEMIQSDRLNHNDYLWRKGLIRWTKIEDIEDFYNLANNEEVVLEEENNEELKSDDTNEYDLDEMGFNDERKNINNKVNSSLQVLFQENSDFFILIGPDREAKPLQYGPFAKEKLKKLFDQKRINSQTYIWTKSLTDWQLLGSFDDYETVFEDELDGEDLHEKRKFHRKPFIARMLFHDKKNLYEGLCRDVSIGGMQIMVSGMDLNVGEIISINVHPQNTDHHFLAKGKIVRKINGNKGFSIRFINISDDAKDSIESYINNTEED
jgi:hypothetical protein